MLTEESGKDQTGDVCKDLTNPFAVFAKGSGGSPKIVWKIKTMPPDADIPAGLGGVDTLSDGTGLHSYVTLKLGSLPGGYTTEAACAVCSNSPVTFTSTAKCPKVPLLRQNTGETDNTPYDKWCKLVNPSTSKLIISTECVYKAGTDELLTKHTVEYIDPVTKKPVTVTGDLKEWTIGSLGCALTSAAMVLKRYGVTSLDDPLLLNKKDVYYKKGAFDFDIAAALGKENVTYVLDSMKKKGGGYELPIPNEIMDYYLQKCIPVMVKVIAKLANGGTSDHWVVVTAKKDGRYLINDPGYGGKIYLSAYDNKIYAIRIFEKKGGMCQ